VVDEEGDVANLGGADVRPAADRLPSLLRRLRRVVELGERVRALYFVEVADRDGVAIFRDGVAIFQNFEVIRRETEDGSSVLVGDRDEDVDDVDFEDLAEDLHSLFLRRDGRGADRRETRDPRSDEKKG